MTTIAPTTRAAGERISARCVTFAADTATAVALLHAFTGLDWYLAVRTPRA